MCFESGSHKLSRVVLSWDLPASASQVAERVSPLSRGFYIFTYSLMCERGYAPAPVKGRQQFAGLGSAPPPCRFWEPNSGHQAWWQVLLPAKPFLWLRNFFLNSIY